MTCTSPELLIPSMSSALNNQRLLFEMSEVKTVDVLIIGAGPAGKNKLQNPQKRRNIGLHSFSL